MAPKITGLMQQQHWEFIKTLCRRFGYNSVEVVWNIINNLEKQYIYSIARSQRWERCKHFITLEAKYH